jgi:hypothetical protein
MLWLATVSELLLYPLAPAAVLLALVYVFSRSPAITWVFFAALCLVALCNLSMLAAGSWHFAMINPYRYERTDPYERIFLPATFVVFLAPLVKAAIPSLKGREPSDRSQHRPE